MLVAGASLSLLTPVVAQASDISIEEMNDYVRSSKSSKKFSSKTFINEVSDEIANLNGPVNGLEVQQNELEAGLASGDFKRAAAPIRKAMGGKMITPGKETHKSNPMPVDNTGTIYSKKGVLPFKVKKGAGIYDHATDQFKPNMDDKEIAMVAKKNINKWKKNKL